MSEDTAMTGDSTMSTGTMSDEMTTATTTG
jgi:hypothetical protein